MPRRAIDGPTRRLVRSDYQYEKSTQENYSVENSNMTGDFAEIRAQMDGEYHGCYDEGRQTLQDDIVKDVIGKGTPHERPWVIFSAGAMGAGKGHVMQWLSEKGFFAIPDIVHVDPDMIRTELPEWKGYLAHNKETAGMMTHRE